jgi:hypothetical protein
VNGAVVVTVSGGQQWCLEQGLRVMYLMTLMTIGLYTPPQGAYLPAVLY